MWSKFKALPVFPKILIIALVLGVLYQAGSNSHQRADSDSVQDAAGNGEGFDINVCKSANAHIQGRLVLKSRHGGLAPEESP